MRLRQRIREEFARSRQTYGSPRLARVLGCPGRRNRIARLMRAERIFARQRSKYRGATTDSRHGGPIAPNRIRALAIKQSNQVWTTDATCVLTAQGWLYLVAVLDVFSRRVIGWAMHQLLDAQLVIAALRMALVQRRPDRSLIIHSDRGAQFASAAYRQLLTQYRLLPSMSRKGNCYDNAFIESFWSTLKYELVYHHHFATHAQARTAIFD
jgi:transposase InsO family protein